MIIQRWPSAGWPPPGATVPSHRGFLTRCTCHRTSSRALACGKSPSQPIALPPTRRALTPRCGIATPLKQKNCTRSTTWPTPIYRKGKTPRRRRSWISPPPCTKPIPSWNSVGLMLWPLSRRVMRSSATPGPTRQRCAFRHCRTGLPFRSWKR